MSNSLKQKLRGKTIKIFGPPGTGKTENLLKRVKRYLNQGYSPDEICYISFTNKAVDECVSRVRNENLTVIAQVQRHLRIGRKMCKPKYE